MIKQFQTKKFFHLFQTYGPGTVDKIKEYQLLCPPGDGEEGQEYSLKQPFIASLKNTIN